MEWVVRESVDFMVGVGWKEVEIRAGIVYRSFRR